MNATFDAPWPYPRPDSPPLLSPGQAEYTLDVWLLPSFSMLTLFCLLEPLRVANRFGSDLFAWRLRSLDGGGVVASNGVRIEVDGELDGVADGASLMVVSSYQPEAEVTARERAVLRRVAAHGGWLGGLDTAPFILARAGVLEGCRVALHWESEPAFRREFPRLAVSPSYYELSATRLTGGGGVASIDMMLAWIGMAYSTALADAVGRQLIYQRHERSPMDIDARQAHLPRSVVKSLTVMEANMARALPIPDICRLAGQSQRQLTRLFRAYFGETPKQCYLGMRLDRAQQLLAGSGCRTTEAAVATGFQHLAHFSRAYRARFGEPPRETAAREAD
ncbi:GlxA family transcriptional regulator [Vreelandella jeotgali]|uniref:GlxA family transcriptional regulator n=1 Tax=Vreelandella jeotgali TaxID=553386 RepID=UPI00068730EE|nr:helix-turn-helix domain-containing protein [Halomonas jeotgali]